MMQLPTTPPTQDDGLAIPHPGTPDFERLIRTLVFVVAGEVREAGADPGHVDGYYAWRLYRQRAESAIQENGLHPPRSYFAFLQTDSPGAQAFREAWADMRAGASWSLDALSRERPGGWLSPYDPGVQPKGMEVLA